MAKPAQYAQAGIPFVWRVEADPLTLTTYELDGSGHRETGRFDDVVALAQPVPLRFRLRELLP